MKAFVVDRYGKNSRLRAGQLSEPEIGDRDVLVRILAAGVNPLDVKIMAGEFKLILPYRPPFVLGNDLAGVVERVGRDVHGFAPGDEVYARPDADRIGTFAELIAIDEGDLAPKPATLTMAEAASLPLVALTAWQALVEKANVQPGQKVLVHAGSGGVGTFAIQLAKHLGAYVATTTSTANVEWVRELGADLVIDYRREDFEQRPLDFDVVLDPLGGENLEKSLRVLRPGGLAIGIAGPPDPDFAKQLGKPLLSPVLAVLSRKVRNAARKNGVRYSFLFMRANGAHLREIGALVDAGTIRPVVDRVFDFDDTAAALDYVRSGRVKGKVVITVEPMTKARAPKGAANTTWKHAPTRTINVGGIEFVYRELGPRGAVPVVFLHHFTAVLDDWDPRVIDGIAAHHHVITFDNRGVGASSGSVPHTIDEMAADAVTFIRALGHHQVDLLGFSLGGGVAQVILLEQPDLVRRAILAGTGPAGGGGIDKMNRIAGVAYGKAALTLRDPKHFLFFPRTPEGKRAATDYMARLKERTEDRDKRISPLAMRAQLKAIRAAGVQPPHDLGKIHQPVLVANGDNDLMVASEHSVDMARRLPNAKLVIYPDSGHGGIFQYHQQFVPEVLEFLGH